MLSLHWKGRTAFAGDPDCGERRLRSAALAHPCATRHRDILTHGIFARNAFDSGSKEENSRDKMRFSWLGYGVYAPAIADL